MPSSCAHCYDRSAREILTIEETRGVLADFTGFRWRQRVAGRIGLTGGDPLLYPGFWQLYLPVHVMLTLTRRNLDEIVPLAAELRGRAARLG